MRKLITLGLIATALLFISSTSVQACSCIPASLTSSVEHFDHIFIGTVIDIYEKDGEDMMTLELEEVLKGSVKKSMITVVGLSMEHAPCCICLRGYEEGVKYLMGGSDDEDGFIHMSTSICSGIARELDGEYSDQASAKVEDVRSIIKGLDSENQSIVFTGKGFNPALNNSLLTIGIISGLSLTIIVIGITIRIVKDRNLIQLFKKKKNGLRQRISKNS